jgi:hypothetical protein
VDCAGDDGVTVKKQLDTRTLFDEPEPVESDWMEVPRERFLSWSEAMQLHYCAQRDLDSAEHAENNEWAEFYLTRAKQYMDDARKLMGDMNLPKGN